MLRKAAIPDLVGKVVCFWDGVDDSLIETILHVERVGVAAGEVVAEGWEAEAHRSEEEWVS